MRLNRTRAAAPAAGMGVTTLELFFDLVFVFTITQVTTVVRLSTDSHGYLRALAILVVTWWMYNGYGWLSNNIAPTDLSTRLPMLVAMTGFLVMAVETPDAFHGGAWPFAIAYLVVVVVHGLQFGRSALGGSARAILRVLPLNLCIAGGLVLAAILADSGHAWIGWLLAVSAIVGEGSRVRGTGFTLRAEHFAERHQLLIIIALGETVVATGASAQGRLDQPAVLTAVVLAMVLLAGLWWVYFGGDDASGSEALASMSEERMSVAAFWAYSVDHLVHIIGLVLLAAGLHDVVLEPTFHLPVRASVTLAVGAAVFLLAEAWFRRLLDIGSRGALVVGAAGCVIVALVGRHVEGLLELEALGTLVVAALVAQPRSVHQP